MRRSAILRERDNAVARTAGEFVGVRFVRRLGRSHRSALAAAKPFNSRRARFAVGFALALVLPCSVQALDPAKSIFQFNIKNWTRQTDLPADKINAITQTPDGYLWLASQNGLIRFDGQEFQLVPIDLPAAQGQEVNRLSVGPDGRLWFAILGGGYGSYDGQKFAAISDPRWTAPGLTAIAIFAARDGSIWTGSNMGWSHWIDGQPKASLFEQGPGPVLTFYQDVSRRVWVGTRELGIFYWENGELRRFGGDDFKGRYIAALTHDPAGNLWIGTDEGLFRSEADGQRHEFFLPDTPVKALLVDRHGVLWVGTASGLGRYDGGKFSFLHAADGLANNDVLSLFEDAEGSLWVGTAGGVSQLSDLKFPIYSSKDGLVPGDAISVGASSRGGLWITTTRGVSYFDGHTATNFVDPAIFPNPYIRRVFEAKNGDVYFCDGLKNIITLRGGRVVARIPNRQWPEAFAEDSTSVLVGVGPRLFRVRGDHLEPYHFDRENDPQQWFNNLAVARDGTIWAATHGGLFRIKDGRSKGWRTADGLPADRVYFVLEDTDGSIWGGTPNGLFRLKDDRVTPITVADGLHDGRIYAIVPDDRNSFWMASGHGVLRASRQSLNDFADGRERRIDCEIFDGLESLQFADRTEQNNSGCKTSDGRIWFPNTRGVLMIDPAHYFTNKLAPRVYIEKVRLNDHDLPGRPGAASLVGERRVEFFFTALSYIAPRKIHLRYQLQGFDPSWIEAGLHRSVVYNNLKAGHYTFRVEGANADAVWNTTRADFSLQVPPAFYETGWFYTLNAVAAAALLAGLYRWKVRQLRARQRLLELKVEERTAELAYERDLLRTLLDRSPDAIYFKDSQSRFIKSSNAQAKEFGVSSPEEIVGKTDFDFHPEAHARQALAEEQEIIRTGQPLIGKVEKIIGASGQPRWLLASKMPLRNKTDEIIGTFGISKDITLLKESEAKLIEVHKQLLATSHQAGMAEVATSVLHNVGNVLNSVNVSASLVSSQVRGSKVSFVTKVSELLRAHHEDLATFLTTDPKGKLLPGYLASLGEQLTAEQAQIVAELSHLHKNVEHIKEIVVLQQSVASASGVTEIVPLTELAEDALRINASSLERHQVEVVREYLAQPVLTLERHKALQILVNLIRNAKHACDDSGRSDKQIKLRITQREDRIAIAVIDNGVGITPENFTRIFAYGFSTRKGGHGFGLHSGALAAKELGGSIHVHSDGLGRGATFTLELPLDPANAATQNPPDGKNLSKETVPRPTPPAVA